MGGMTFADRLKELRERATKGPWNLVHRCIGGPKTPDPDVDEICGLGWDWDDTEPFNAPPEPMRGAFEKGADAALIVHLVNHAEAIERLVRAAESMPFEEMHGIRFNESGICRGCELKDALTALGASHD